MDHRIIEFFPKIYKRIRTLRFLLRHSSYHCYTIRQKFEEMRILKMQMTKVGDYYYLCRSSHDGSKCQPEKLASALQVLHKEKEYHRERNATLTPLDIEKTVSMASASFTQTPYSNHSAASPSSAAPLTQTTSLATGLFSPSSTQSEATMAPLTPKYPAFTSRVSSPHYPSKLCSQNFVAVSSKGDKYMRTIEGFYAEDNKRVRPISGPADLDGGTNHLDPLFSKEQESQEAQQSKVDESKERRNGKSIKRAQSTTTFDKSSKHRVFSGSETPVSGIDTSSITTGR